MSDILPQVQMLVSSGAIRVSQHGLRELADDGIDLEDVLAGIASAVVVEEYPTSRMEPSVLILQNDRHGPIHVMWGVPKVAGTPAVLVTAYRPNPERWSPDFTRRK
jgi:hypothetical protein